MSTSRLRFVEHSSLMAMTAHGSVGGLLLSVLYPVSGRNYSRATRCRGPRRCSSICLPPASISTPTGIQATTLVMGSAQELFLDNSVEVSQALLCYSPAR